LLSVKVLVVTVLPPGAAALDPETKSPHRLSLYNSTLDISSETSNVTWGVLVLPGDAGVVMRNEMVGVVVSTTIFLFAERLPTPPGAGRLREALLPAKSLIDPPFTLNGFTKI
jgi:hypothetical protein